MPRDGFSFNFNTGGAIRKDGSFDVAGVLPGSYNLGAMKLEGMAQTLGVRQVEVGKQDLEDVVVNAEVLADLRGSIRLEGPEKQATPGATGSSMTSTPNPKFRISVFPTDGIPFNTPDSAANDEGEFTLKGLGAGKYRVNVNGMPAGSYLKSIMFGGQDALDAGLDLSAGAGDSALQIVVSRTAGQVSGVVQGEDGKPAPGSMVTLVPDPPRPEQSNLYRTAPTDQSGQFNLDSLRPGKYRIYAWEELEPGLQFEPEILRAVESRGTAVTVAESATQQLTATQISSASLEDAKRRAGR
jgi:hypothetical protein